MHFGRRTQGRRPLWNGIVHSTGIGLQSPILEVSSPGIVYSHSVYGLIVFSAQYCEEYDY